jgi:hypothetical protein
VLTWGGAATAGALLRPQPATAIKPRHGNSARHGGIIG